MAEKDIKQALLERGVTIRCPDSVDIDASINPLRIAPGTTIHSGSRLSGDQTSIGPGSKGTAHVMETTIRQRKTGSIGPSSPHDAYAVYTVCSVCDGRT